MTQHRSRKMNYLKHVVIVMLIFAFAFLMTSCSSEKNEEVMFSSGEDFLGKRIGDITGSVNISLYESQYGDIEGMYYEDMAGMIEANKKGDIDAILVDYPFGKAMCEERPDMALFPEDLMEISYVWYFKKGDPMCAEVTAVLDQLRTEGYMDYLSDKWFDGPVADRVIDWTDYDTSDKGNGVIRYYFQNEAMPVDYVGEGGQSIGYEVELLLEVAKRMDKGVEITPVKLTSLLVGLQQGKCDCVGGAIAYTEARAETMDASSPTVESCVRMMTMKDRIDPSLLGDVEEYSSDTESGNRLLNSLYRTFVEEDRWKMILDGLGVTMLITIVSCILGLFLGVFLSYARSKGDKVLKAILEGLCDFITGTPTLVILLVVYFVVFATASIDPIIAGIVTFTIICMVDVSGITLAGMNSIDKGQYEGAYSLGFSHPQTILYVIIPQTVHHVGKLYIGEVITIMKATSIVGYISVLDLTKVSDIIRSRTFEAFVPLISTALIYYIISKVLLKLLSRLKNITNPIHGMNYLTKGLNRDVVLEIPKIENTGDSDEEVIRLEHVKKEYSDVTPLTDVNAVIKRGETIAVIGPSGTGKSTLLRMINRMEDPTSGKVLVFGEDNMDSNTNLQTLRQKVGMVFQSFNLLHNYSVIENVMLAPVLLQKRDRQEVYDFAMKLLYAVGMASKADNSPESLSGGQQQRVAIARALAMKPEAILFDEPTSALDPSMVDGVLTIIQGLADMGMTLMIVTHEMNFARKVSDRVFYMDCGEIYEEGAPEQIFEHPQRNRTQAFVNKMNTLVMRINSKDFDQFDISSKVDAFTKQRKIEYVRTDRLKDCLHDVLMTDIVPANESEPRLTVLVETDGQKLLFKLISDTEKSEDVERSITAILEQYNSVIESFSFKQEPDRNELEVVFK